MNSSFIVFPVAALVLVASPIVGGTTIDRTHADMPGSSFPAVNTKPLQEVLSPAPRPPAVFNPITPPEVSGANDSRSAAQRMTEGGERPSVKNWRYSFRNTRSDDELGSAAPELVVTSGRGTAAASVKAFFDNFSLMANDAVRNRKLEATGKLKKFSPVDRRAEWGFGNSDLLRGLFVTNFKSKIESGHVINTLDIRVASVVQGRRRNVAVATFDASAPVNSHGTFVGRWSLDVFGMRVVEDQWSDAEPWKKGLGSMGVGSYDIMSEYFGGSVRLDLFEGFPIAFKVIRNPLTIKPSIAVGPGSVGLRAEVYSSVGVLAEAPLANLWGFANLVLRLDLNLLKVSAEGGEVLEVALDTNFKPSAFRREFVVASIDAGGAEFKVKAESPFLKAFSWLGIKSSFSLFKIFKIGSSNLERVTLHDSSERVSISSK